MVLARFSQRFQLFEAVCGNQLTDIYICLFYDENQLQSQFINIFYIYVEKEYPHISTIWQANKTIYNNKSKVCEL